ncbi:unnamed protein product [Diatraea saccharalis]|uniref:Beta-glucosidase n=1 Tax=Diatraea saccharalis TaxID=40085 RepID=A0A9N9R962_9NEOP|nr:unnamed protein product [Diatraea saccharalis]
MVTMYHWELPQRLQDLGGWANPLIVDWFGDYSRVLFSLYGDRVKTWITINEAMSVCDIGYSDQNFAPGIEDFTIGRYLCSKNIVVAHARAYRIYDEEFRAKYNGRVSLANHFMWFEPQTSEDEDVAELAIQLAWGRYSHPIFSKEGGYPQAIEEIFANYSAAEGYTTSRLPAFTKEEIEYTRGTFDFICMNHYTSRMVRRAVPGEAIGHFPLDGSEELNLIIEMHPDSKPTGYPLLPVMKL